MRKNNKKIISLSQLKKKIALIKKRDKKIVLVGGCFDIFHYGHLIFLKKAKAVGDFLIILLESDDFIKKIKKREPIHNQNQRAEILSSISYVDMIIKIPYFKNDKQYFDVVKIIQPTIIAVSEGDVNFEKKERQAKIINGKIKIVSKLLPKFSSQKIIAYFKD